MKEITAAMPVSQRATGLAADTSYVEWGAVWAGGALAAALSFVLLAFGTAIGLSFVSPWPDASMPIWLITSVAIFWTMAQQIGAAMAGGYVAGRMRSRWGEASEDELRPKFSCYINRQTGHFWRNSERLYPGGTCT